MTLLRTHKQVLSFIGAGIVLLTFLIKDTWSDHLRDVSEAIENAQQLYSIRKDNEGVLRVLGNVYQRVRYPSNQEHDIDIGGSSDHYQNYLGVFRVQQEYDKELNLLSDLSDHLPDQENNTKRLAGLRTRLDSASDRLEKITASAAPDPQDVAATIEKNLQEFRRISRETSGIMHSTGDLSSSMLLEAKGELASISFRRRIMSAISFVLFTLGWGLSVLSLYIAGETRDDEQESFPGPL
jgi:hypothetical protein